MSQLITDVDRIKWIRYLQCNLGELADTTSKAYAFRKRNRDCLRNDLILLNNVIRILYKYVAFDDVVTYAYSFTFQKTVSNSETITLNIDGEPYPYVSSSDDVTDIVNYYYKLFQNSVQNPDLYAEKDGNTLYVFSYDNALTFSSTTAPNASSNYTTIAAASMEDNLQDILNLWNCITNEQLCSLIYIAHALENDCQC
jgi:hypothetical protein